MKDILAEICAKKREHIAACKATLPEAELAARCRDLPPLRGFANALAEGAKAKRATLIAEIKKASPSQGVLREDFDVPAIARAYEEGGAACLSVLTDEPYFQGDDAYIATAKNACSLPILRKDFMLDPYQITEARAIGANAVLLILAALSDDEAKTLEHKAIELGLDVLLEVHNEQELERALRLSSPLIGINNRNLKTLEISLETSIELSSLIPEDKTIICESGIKNAADIHRMQAANIHCFLVGHSLMLQRNICSATKELLGLTYESGTP